jgi:hypothetical protein
MVAPSHIEEIRKAAPNELSHKAAGNIIFQTSHTLHPALEHDQTHFEIVVKALTPALNTQLMDLVDEAKLVFSEQIGEPKGRFFKYNRAHQLYKLTAVRVEGIKYVAGVFSHGLTSFVAPNILY